MAIENKKLDAAAIAEQRRKVEELRQNKDRPGAAGILVAEEQKLEDMEKEKEITLPVNLSPKTLTQKPDEEKKQIETKIGEKLGLPKLEVTEPAAPTVPPTIGAPKETGIAPPRVVKAPPMDFSSTVKNMEAIFQEYQKGRQLPEEQRKSFEQKQQDIRQALNDAKEVYNLTTDQARSEADRREALTQWASIAESFSQSLIKFFAAREGARTGQLLGSKIAFEKYDWQKDLDRSLNKLKLQTDEAKSRLGIAREEAEAGIKGLEAERKAATQMQEEVAGKRLSLLSDVEKEKIRQQSKSVEEYTQAVNRAELERYQQDMALKKTGEAAVAKKELEELKLSTKQSAERQKIVEDTKGIIAKTLAQDPKSSALATSKGQLTENYVKLFNPQQQIEIEQEVADKLGKEQSWVRNALRGIGFMSEQLTPKEQGIATKALAEALKKRLGPADQATPVVPAAPTTAEAMVDMIAPDGRELKVPASRVAEMETKGARRK